MKLIVLAFLSSTLFIANAQITSIVGQGKPVNPYKYTIQKTANFSKAATCSAHPLASLVGAQIMRQGGNAYDAVIAMQWALAVVYPQAGNIGGGGFLVGSHHQKKIITIDFRETAPKAATKDMYLNTDGTVNEEASTRGALAAGIPGTPAGLFATLPYAKLPMAKLIQPAIDLAAKGFVITQQEANNLNELQSSFSKYSSQPSAFIKATAWKAGDTLVQTDLAQTLTRIQRYGSKGFYEGKTAELIVNEMKKTGGIITLSDLKNYKVVQRKPIVFTYKNYSIASMNLPSSGGVLLNQMMKMIEDKNISNQQFQTFESVQLMIEAERRAYADRATHLGDPAFYKVPLQTLTSNAYIKQRMSTYKAGEYTPSSSIAAGAIAPPKQSEQTTHLNAADAQGNVVAVTTTLNDSYGSHTVVAHAGFLLNNEMDDFSAKPGSPNMYGAVGGVANAIQPLKRMLSSMTPTIVFKNNKPYIVVGTPGGTTIPTSVFQTLVNMLEFNMSANEAINAPKFHHQWLPDVVFTEKTFNPQTAQQLQAKGYTIKPRGNIGRTEVIQIMPNGKLNAAADTRGDDSVAGF